MPDENQIKKEEQANQELIRLAELRIKEINASASNIGKKAILIATISIAYLGLLISSPITDEKYSPDMNFWIGLAHLVFVFLFLRIALNTIFAINWEDINLPNWGDLIDGMKNSSIPLVEIQRKVLSEYVGVINLMEEMHAERFNVLKKSVFSFLFGFFGSILFIIIVSALTAFSEELAEMGINIMAPSNDENAASAPSLQGKDG